MMPNATLTVVNMLLFEFATAQCCGDPESP